MDGDRGRTGAPPRVSATSGPIALGSEMTRARRALRSSQRRRHDHPLRDRCTAALGAGRRARRLPRPRSHGRRRAARDPGRVGGHRRRAARHLIAPALIAVGPGQVGQAIRDQLHRITQVGLVTRRRGLAERRPARHRTPAPSLAAAPLAQLRPRGGSCTQASRRERPAPWPARSPRLRAAPDRPASPARRVRACTEQRRAVYPGHRAMGLFRKTSRDPSRYPWPTRRAGATR